MVDVESGELVLASFNNPPVVEVAMGVEFLPLPDLTMVPLVQLSAEWQSDYPVVQEQPAIPPTVDVFGPATFDFEIQSGVPPVRLWLVSESGAELLQIQRDRFILNWRRTGPDERYPSFNHLELKFGRHWHRFLGRIEQESIGSVHALAVEVTFVNAFALSEHETLYDALTILAGPPTFIHARPSIEMLMDLGDFPGSNSAGEQRISVSHDVRNPHHFSLTLITRVKIEGSSPNPIQDAMRRAHSIGVKSFEMLTTPRMHKRWEIQT